MKKIIHKINIEKFPDYLEEIYIWKENMESISQKITPSFIIEKNKNEISIIREYYEGEILTLKKSELFYSIKQLYMILSSLSQFHRANIPHMNIKPENILFKDNNTILLDPMPPDFYNFLGIDDDDLRKKLKYGPPEAAIGYKSSFRADIYRLGVIFYIILTGENPFSNIDPVLEGKNHITDNITPPDFINPEIPLYISRIILRMIAKVKEERFPNADSVIYALIRKEIIPPPSNAKFIELDEANIEYKDQNMKRVIIIIILALLFSIIYLLSEYIKWNIFL